MTTLSFHQLTKRYDSVTALDDFTAVAQPGRITAFLGANGSGKTTQRKLFKTWLQSEGFDVVTTKWNSSEPIKPIIRSRKALRALSPEEFSLLHAAYSSRVTVTVLKSLGETPAHNVTFVPSLNVPIGTSTPEALRSHAS